MCPSPLEPPPGRAAGPGPSAHLLPRRWLMAVGAAVGLAVAGWPRAVWPREGQRPTPPQMEGPYYPVEPIPLRRQLRQLGGRTAQGEGLLLRGQVWRQGQPVPQARVEIWQCDARGVYRHPDQAGEVDPGFAGYGAQLTDAEGRYAFDTLMPVPYTGRPPHIHVRVKLGPRTALTTQLYLPGQTEEAGFLRRLAPGAHAGRDQLTLRLQPAAAGQPAVGVFDLVLV